MNVTFKKANSTLPTYHIYIPWKEEIVIVTKGKKVYAVKGDGVTGISSLKPLKYEELCKALENGVELK